jgi:rhodanese-related sulfurtransferase
MLPFLPGLAALGVGPLGYRTSEQQTWFYIGAGIFLLAILVYAVVKLRDVPHNSRAKLNPTMDPIQVEELMHGTPPLILDLRPVEEFKGKLGHLRGALNIPFSELARRIDEVRGSTGNRPVILVDQDDRLSHLAVPLMRKEGFEWLYVLKGGMKWWVAKKLPVYH